jgi:hypothetical protein
LQPYLSRNQAASDAGHIVSLLFLADILEPFRAQDESGRPLAHAVLTFWRSGTTAPLHVYADQALDEQLSDPQGRVFADGGGEFPIIYLQDGVTYRVKLETAQGVLRWDIDPYICDCTDPPYIFREPVVHARTPEGRPLPGAQLRFSITETDTPTNTYANAALTIPHPNPIRADAGGFFPPIYLADEVEYRVLLSTASGELLRDIDPYECYCGFLLLTSYTYPLDMRDGTAHSFAPWGGMFAPIDTDEMAHLFGVAGGELKEPTIEYDWPPDEMAHEFGLTGGTLIIPVVTYADWPPDEMEHQFGPTGGTLISPIVNYADWPPDEMEHEFGVTGGTLV